MWLAKNSCPAVGVVQIVAYWWDHQPGQSAVVNFFTAHILTRSPAI
ncbi:hypothetical protein BH11BAC3_BH11BAC3_22500 [soil metagenome]